MRGLEESEGGQHYLQILFSVFFDVIICLPVTVCVCVCVCVCVRERERERKKERECVCVCMCVCWTLSTSRSSMHHKLCSSSRNVLCFRMGWSHLLAAAKGGENVSCRESHLLAAAKLGAGENPERTQQHYQLNTMLYVQSNPETLYINMNHVQADVLISNKVNIPKGRKWQRSPFSADVFPLKHFKTFFLYPATLLNPL